MLWQTTQSGALVDLHKADSIEVVDHEDGWTVDAVFGVRHVTLARFEKENLARCFLEHGFNSVTEGNETYSYFFLLSQIEATYECIDDWCEHKARKTTDETKLNGGEKRGEHDGQTKGQ